MNNSSNNNNNNNSNNNNNNNNNNSYSNNNNNSNNNSCNNNSIDKLFKLCWSNIYIRSVILNHLRIYNSVYEYTKNNMFCFKVLKLFKYKSYIKVLNFHSDSYDFNFDVDDIDENLFYGTKSNSSSGSSGISNSSGSGDSSGIGGVIKEEEQQQEENCKLPYGIESLIVHSNFSFSSSSIPSSVTSLCFTSEFDQELQCDIIPSSVSKLSIESMAYSKQIKPGVIPNSVVSLSFGSNTFSCGGGDGYDGSSDGSQVSDKCSNDSGSSSSGQILIEGSIPSSVTYLDLGNFNQNISTNLLPDSIVDIKFYSFNSIIQKLPSDLKSIAFNREFNQDLLYNGVSILPSSLLYIDLGQDFNREIIDCNTFPSNLKSINFGDSFDQFIHKDILPASLESIILGHYFRQSIENINFNSLPNLKYLEFYSTEYHLKLQPELVGQLSSIIFNRVENEKQTIYYGI